MEISSSYGQVLIKKEVKSPPTLVGSPPTTSLATRNNHSNVGEQSSASAMEELNNVISDDNAAQQNVMMQQLQLEHDIQKECLRRQYQQQQHQLAIRHEKQVQLHRQYLEKQTQLAEEELLERQRQDKDERIEAIKNKTKDQHSGNASFEVKQRLQEKLLRKKIQNCDQSTSSGSGSPNIRNWPAGHILAGSEDFPLRKTASEPNINLKLRIKNQRERRSSPLAGRKDRILGPRRRPLPHVDSASPDSGQNSPPNGLPASRSSSGSTPIHEEGGGSPYGAGGQGSCTDLTHPFTSLPNISLGRPPHSSSHNEGAKLAMVSETEMLSAAKAGLPLTGHVLPSTLPNYPTLPGIESGEAVSSEICSRIPQVDPATTTSPLVGGVYTIGVVPPDAQARLRTLQRPLGRTQSAPLPLGHPMLAGPPPTFLQHVHGGPPTIHQYDHSLIKQQIRETVMKRSGSKNHVEENLEEETEAAVARAIGNEKVPEEETENSTAEDSAEVMYISEKKMEEGDSIRYDSPGNVLYPPLYPYQREILLGQRSSGTTYSGTIVGPRSGSHAARPLTRAQSSPSVTLPPAAGSPQESMVVGKQGATTGIAYETMMKKHQCICGENSHHPENGYRIQAIWSSLQDAGLTQRCNKIRSRKATLEEIQSCHSEAHTVFFGTSALHRQQFDIRKLGEVPIKNFVRLQCGGIGVDSDTTWNDLHTSSAAKMAVGCFLELAFKVASGELRNGYAIIRPPGHHAEYQQAMGFCFFNTVAITAKQLQQKYNYDKILILDWDVHHGNGTQAIFYDDPHILYLSIHRYDDGSFFPGTGGPTEVGSGDGNGFNVNISWSGGLNPPMGDAEYLAAFRSVVMPIARDFDPDIVLVSAGFDAADDHPSPLGGYKVSPACFAYMTKELMTLAKGKVVLALEGGYTVESICDCSLACVQALLDDEIPPISEQEFTRRPCANAVETLQNVISLQTIHWPVVRRGSCLVGLSALEAQGREEEQETVSAMASLRVDQHGSHNPSPEPVPKSSVNMRARNDEEEPMDEDDK